MLDKIQRIKSAINADIGSFLRALYDYDIPRNGNLWFMGDVHGTGGSSLKVFDNGTFKDFASDSNLQGDLIDLARHHWDCSNATLYDRLESMLGLDNEDFRRPHPVDLTDTSLETADIDDKLSSLSFADSFFAKELGLDDKASSVAPVRSIPPSVAAAAKSELPPWKPAPEEDPWSTKKLRWASNTLSFVWPFTNEKGEIIFWKARFEHASGKRFSLAYFSDDGWINKKPRLQKSPILGLADFMRLKEVDTETVIIIVEGEKAASVGNSLRIPGVWFTTWDGGASNTNKTDFTPLFGRRILLWPDNDSPGKQCMLGLYSVFNSKAMVHIATLRDDWAAGDDIVDIHSRYGPDYLNSFLLGELDKVPRTLEQSGDIESDHQEPNQLGSVYRLIDRYGKDLKFSIERNQWYIWRDGIWQLDVGGGKVFQYTMDIVNSVYKDCVSNDPKEVVAYSKRAKSIQHMRGIMDGASMMSQIAVSENDFDPDPDCIATANGLLNLATGELTPLTRAHMASKIIPFRYDPKAPATRFKEFLKQIMQDKTELVTFLQDFFGYCLTGNPPDRIFPIFWGGGKNGKSTLVNIILAVMGDYASAARVETIMASDKADKIGEDLIQLRGGRFTALQESEKGMKLNEAKIKGLTGRDRLRCRYLHSNTWLEWTNTAKIILSTNNRPRMTGNDKGLWDRIALVPFNFRVREEDSELHTRILATEGEGVLAWMVEGALRYYKNGKKIYRPEEVCERTKQYQEEEDTLGQFVDECLFFSPDARIMSSELYRVYRRWMEDREDGAIKGSRNFSEEIAQHLEDLQVKKNRSSKGFYYEGVAQRTEGQESVLYASRKYQSPDVQY